MVQINHTKVGSSTRFPHIANITGRPSIIAGNLANGRAKFNAPISINKPSVTSSRHAMSDRTNGHAKTSNDLTLEKVMQSCIYVQFIR